MKASKNIKLMAAVAAASLLLSACGGGGGGNSSAAPATGASAPAVPASGVAPQTSIPATTYAADSFQATAFATLNNYRAAMGVGTLKQDPVLDTSAQAHALYLFSNLKTGALTSLSHDEVATNQNYYGDSPLSRAQKAGAPATEWIAENVAAGVKQSADVEAAQDCIGQALASVYHLVALTSNQESVGLGFNPGDTTYPIYTCASDFGTSTGVPGNPLPNAFTSSGGQILQLGLVYHSPYANEGNVALAMRPESPNPATDLAAPGRPILVQVNSQSGNTLTVSQFTIADSSGAVVPTRILVQAKAQPGSTATTVVDPNNLLPSGTAILLPLAALKASTTYTVTFNGARDGSAVSSTWNFTTAAN
ncbi:CAP domain-containing protein [Burkholderia sp. PAMC 26561]|uniref:CAP domain-containing protein n=1 Tax=Burkholderia sp. PAMC 26561 TaxID=1795043 RepID=UPI00076B03B7|nr:CAP domain-containing protein [Burkholderia sp. PAMC 26561]AME28722.1 hypothetical protein AXG89_33630 [Burkholderia sp. PAMC 26561]